MTNRSEIEASFTTRDGRITNPGKFEFEPIWTVYFHEIASDGEELSHLVDGVGVYASLVEIEPDDRAEFPELGANAYVLVEENDQGFVTTTLIADEAEAEEIREKFAEDEAEAEDEDDFDEDDEGTMP